MLTVTAAASSLITVCPAVSARGCPFSSALAILTATVCVSVRSGSVKASVPWVAVLGISSPPFVSVPDETKLTFCCGLVMTGASLVPVTVIVIVVVPVWSSG
jgi:hypothetical protein